jgi:26S proteasome regulatory subunit N9
MDVENALEAQRKARPDLVGQLDTVQKFGTEKLYHQLTQALLEYLGNACFEQASAAAELLAFFNGYIKSFQDKFNKLHTLKILAIVAKQQTPDVALELLAPFEESVKGDRDATWLLQILKSEKLVLAGKFDQAKDDLEKIDKSITDSYEVDAYLQSAFHKTYAMLWKTLGRPQEFFKSSILYLAFTPVSAIRVEERPRLAFEIGVAAMVAEEEFIFGDLLQQELLATLDGSEFAWVKDFLVAYGEGKFEMYDAALAKYKTQLEATPELKGKEETVLRPKMAALALIEFVFRKGKSERRIPFAQIAEHCRVDIKQVEQLLMKAMCAQLIKGKIDEVAQQVVITWVKPRILDIKRIDLMRDRMDQWMSLSDSVIQHLEEATPELLVS